MKFVVMLSCLLCFVNGNVFRVDPLVLTTQGLIRGLKASDNSYNIFLGVPYASINVDNPFGPLLPHPGFGSHVFNAYNGLIKCPQTISMTSRSSETEETLDCLTMNIYSPTKAGTQSPLPVLVWIHGGDFAVGSASDFDPEKLVREDIIVVTINYRLGPYGFMCLDHPSVSGNQGLKDQYKALQWIRDNIRAFGGNPYNVTIGGQEAGSASVLYHLYSDKDKLYKNVIVESGTPQNIGMFVNGDEETAFKIASHLGFNTTDIQEALNFLAESSYVLVAAAASDLNLELKPCREKSFSGVENFIEDEPLHMSNVKKVENTPVLIGHKNNEFAGSLLIRDSNYLKKNPFYDKIKENFNLDEDKLSETADVVRHFYIGDEDISEVLQTQLEKFESDITVNHPIQRTITKLLSENANPIYEYEYAVETNDHIKDNTKEIENLITISNSNFDSSGLVAKMWSNFIKYGNPTPYADDLVRVEWAPVTAVSRPYLVIDFNVEIKRRINNDRMAFWDLFYILYEKNNKFLRECKLR